MWTSPGGRSRFQSSPVPKDGCNPSDLTLELLRERFRFNPHPSRRTGATCCRRLVYNGDAGFQSSPVPKDGCNRPTRIHGDSRLPVSILTRPEGRVQRRPSSAEREAFQVSILTRPEGRVQHFLKNFSDGGYSFQSSPVPKDGCNQKQRKATATSVSFNPHPSRRTGATTRTFRRHNQFAEFQSSPVPKDGCNRSA